MEIEKLLNLAQNAAHEAYSPYSKYSVGAAVTTGSGEVVTAANVEISAFNPSTHAEQNAIAGAVSNGHREFNQIAIADLERSGILPCGHCRQIMAEFCGSEFDIYSLTADDHQHWTLGELFPEPFEY